MTLPYERFNSVKNTERFLLDLMDPSKTPRVPKAIRQRARQCLRHYPGSYDMVRAAEAVPDVFAASQEELSTWIVNGVAVNQPDS